MQIKRSYLWLPSILVMEILALMIAKGNLKLYKSTTGLNHLLDIYADDMTIYLECNRKKDRRNKCMSKRSYKLCAISGMGKHIQHFLVNSAKPMFVNELKIKWCTKFKLLLIYFNVMSKMQIKYEKAIKAMRRKLHSWTHRFQTVFGKISN